MNPIKDLEITKGISIDEIMKQMGEGGGFTAKNLSLATDVIEKMTKDVNSVNFLSFPADIIATGARGVIKDMIKNNMFNVIVTTCGTLDHDIARCFRDYNEGSFDADDKELAEKGINRLGNIFIPNSSYGDIIE